jgi:hypothetical protein
MRKSDSSRLLSRIIAILISITLFQTNAALAFGKCDDPKKSVNTLDTKIRTLTADLKKNQAVVNSLVRFDTKEEKRIREQNCRKEKNSELRKWCLSPIKEFPTCRDAKCNRANDEVLRINNEITNLSKKRDFIIIGNSTCFKSISVAEAKLRQGLNP